MIAPTLERNFPRSVQTSSFLGRQMCVRLAWTDAKGGGGGRGGGPTLTSVMCHLYNNERRSGAEFLLSDLLGPVHLFHCMLGCVFKCGRRNSYGIPPPPLSFFRHGVVLSPAKGKGKGREGGATTDGVKIVLSELRCS